MKKIVTLLTAVVMAMTITACSESEKPKPNPNLWEVEIKQPTDSPGWYYMHKIMRNPPPPNQDKAAPETNHGGAAQLMFSPDWKNTETTDTIIRFDGPENSALVIQAVPTFAKKKKAVIWIYSHWVRDDSGNKRICVHSNYAYFRNNVAVNPLKLNVTKDPIARNERTDNVLQTDWPLEKSFFNNLQSLLGGDYHSHIELKSISEKIMVIEPEL